MANPATGANLPLGSLALLWLAGLYLRLPILVAPPLSPLIGSELDLGQTALGALTTLPVLMLAVGALPGSFAIAHVGPRLAVAGALVLLAIASAARGLAPPAILLFVFTVLMGFGIALMQPALPVLVKRWCPGHLALGSAVYMNGLLAGEFLGAGLTLPLLMPWLGHDWRWALVVWSLPALVVAAAVALHRRRAEANSDGSAAARPGWLPRWREGRVWQLGVLLAAASAGFFGTNAYLGSVLAELGRPEALAGALFAFNATQLGGSLLMIAVGRHLVGRRWPVIAMTVALLLGLAGISFSGPGWFMVAVIVLGLATCVQLILMVSVVPLITTEHEAGPLAAGMFAIGYLLGFLVPLAGGVLADTSGIARLALVPIAALGVLALAVAVARGFGHGASRMPGAGRTAPDTAAANSPEGETDVR